jgi:hypothetical protein
MDAEERYISLLRSTRQALNAIPNRRFNDAGNTSTTYELVAEIEKALRDYDNTRHVE